MFPGFLGTGRGFLGSLLSLSRMLWDHEPGRAALLRRLADRQVSPTRFLGGAGVRGSIRPVRPVRPISHLVLPKHHSPKKSSQLARIVFGDLALATAVAQFAFSR